MKYLALDIETTPFEITHKDIIQYLMDKKISKERRSLDANYSKIIVISVKDENKINLFYNDDEKQLLEEFWKYLKDKKDFMIVTHNGYKFDIPFLVLRSCINNVKVPVSINLNRWQMEKSNHFDIMMFFSQYETFTNPNLEILGKLHDIEVSGSRISGSDIEELYKNGEIDKIKERCKQDVELIDKIFKKLCLKHLER